MKRRLVIWGVILTTGGWLLFRFWLGRVYPEALRYLRAGNGRQFWDGLTVAQKLFIAGMEIPCLTGIVLLFIALAKAVRQNSVK
jgi:hypothetical protein